MESPRGNTIQTRPIGAKLKSKRVLNGLHHIYYWSGNKSGLLDFKKVALLAGEIGIIEPPGIGSSMEGLWLVYYYYKDQLKK
ncbi:MAG: hypothetical protein ABUK01_09900 [Leptospirales bacterium]